MSDTVKYKSKFLSPGQVSAYKKKSPNKSKNSFSSKGNNKSLNSSKRSETISAYSNNAPSPIRNPFLVKTQKSLNKKKKKKKFNNVKSFDDRLRSDSVSKKNKKNIEDHFQASIENELNDVEPKNSRKGSLPNYGILRHKSWKKIRRSTYSVAMKDKKSKLDNSSNSKTSTIDSLGLNNKFNKSGNSNANEEMGANTGRVDQFKNPIIRGRKRHKVSFARKSVTIDVESWKKLNLKLTMKPNKNKGCIVCSIF
jgi:hypothetical protein